MDKYIQDIRNSGELIILNDGSKWAVSSFDAFHTRMWMRFDKVEVSNNTITNKSRNNKTVSARRT